MAENEKVLEELYELLGLYFTVNLPGGIIGQNISNDPIEPALDHVVLKEQIFAKITSLIVDKEVNNYDKRRL